MLAGLAETKVEFVVIGGVAATVHGSVAVTIDLDICYNPSDRNRARLAALLTSWQAYPRGAPPDLPFILDERMLSAAPILTLTTCEGALDCLDMVAGVGTWTDVRAATTMVRWDALRFRVLTLEALIAAKRAAGRPKDRAAVIELEAIRALRESGA